MKFQFGNIMVHKRLRFSSYPPAVFRRWSPLGRPRAISALRKATKWRMIGVLFASIALAFLLSDYIFDWQATLLPFSQVPRSNPFTFLALICAMLATFGDRPFNLPTPREKRLWVAAVFFVSFFPWSRDISLIIFNGLDLGATGWNTALTVTLIAVSQCFRGYHTSAALFAGGLALCLPFSALSGYLMGHHRFFGEMSLTTMAVLVPLGLANVLRFPRHHWIAPLLSPNQTGHLLRMHLRVWGIVYIGMPLFIRWSQFTAMDLYPFLHTFEAAIILGCILYFGMHYSHLLDRQRRTEQKLLVEVTTDALTGAATRAAAVKAFLRMKGNKPAGLILMKMDHFKVITDLHGHAAGDDVLRSVAQCLSEELTIFDTASRWSDQEFLIMVRVPDHTALVAITERLRLATHSVPIVQGRAGYVTASFGAVLVHPMLEPDLPECVEIAQMAMKKAKQSGRDCSVVVQAESGEWSELIEATAKGASVG